MHFAFLMIGLLYLCRGLFRWGQQRLDSVQQLELVLAPISQIQMEKHEDKEQNYICNNVATVILAL